CGLPASILYGTVHGAYRLAFRSITVRGTCEWPQAITRCRSVPSRERISSGAGTRCHARQPVPGGKLYPMMEYRDSGELLPPIRAWRAAFNHSITSLGSRPGLAKLSRFWWYTRYQKTARSFDGLERAIQAVSQIEKSIGIMRDNIPQHGI